jgi:hypothetical protein
MSDPAVPHVRFEYDPEFEGGDYPGVGSFAFVAMSEVDELGAEAAFTKKTGLPDTCMVNYSLDDLYDASGARLPDEADEPVGPTR